MQMVDKEAKAREYSVYVSGTGTSGSAALYYRGGDTCYVFTCAHVVYQQDEIKVSLLIPINASKDSYQTYQATIPGTQVYLSPLANPQVDEYGNVKFDDDLAIIPVHVVDDMKLKLSEYYVCDASGRDNIFFQGYPEGIGDGRSQVVYINELHGYVHVSVGGENVFTIRITDTNLDQGGRTAELQGFSGSPVWYCDDGKHNLEGLITSTFGQNALLARVNAVKSERIRILMKEHFGVTMERRLTDIPDEDVAGSAFLPVTFNGTVPSEETTTEYDEWLKNERTIVRAHINDLQLQKAIDVSLSAINDVKFSKACKQEQKKLMQYLLYCYEITDLDDEFKGLEEEMNNKGLIKGHDPLRRLTRSFMRREFGETIAAAEEYLKDSAYQNNKSLMSLSRVFLILSKAYTEELPAEETIGTLIDQNGNLLVETEKLDDASLVYQMIGYVYGQRYREPEKSVCFLNKSYEIGFDNVVLESLAGAYYILGIKGAVDENDIVDIRLVDIKTLNIARNCFLTIQGKADQLFWAGTMRRMGLLVLNTFYFLHDVYRTLTIYPDVRKYCTGLEAKDIRDAERKYALLLATRGHVDLSQFDELTQQDEILIQCHASFHNLGFITEGVKGLFCDAAWISDELNKSIELHIRSLEKVDSRDTISLRVNLMNLYAKGILLLGWDSVEMMEIQMVEIRKSGQEELISALENLLLEFKLPIEETIKRYQETFEKRRTLPNWGELLNLYIRHELFDYADEWYRELFFENFDLIRDNPEAAYRDYMDYILHYQRNIKDAIKCFLKAKKEIIDSDISSFWELELMAATNTYNNPERFEKERWPFVERDLLSETAYHQTAFIAYLANLNPVKTQEHHCYIRGIVFPQNQDGRLLLPNFELDYLCLIGLVVPQGNLNPQGMNDWIAEALKVRYQEEPWHKTISIPLRNRFAINRVVCLDAWALYYLAYHDKLNSLLTAAEKVYLTHSSVIRLLGELARTNNLKLRMLINGITANTKIALLSPGFETQLQVREIGPYYEPQTAVALGRELDCVTIIGEPETDASFIKHFGAEIVRASDVQQLLENC